MAPRARPLTKPLIIGGIADEHVAAVVEQLDKRAARATIVDTAKLETGSYRVVDSWAEVDDDIIDFRQPRKGWIRRLAPPHWRRRTQGASEEAAVRSPPCRHQSVGVDSVALADEPTEYFHRFGPAPSGL